MKNLGVKMILFGSYVVAVLLAWVFPVVSGFAALMVKLVLLYCGLIVVTHLGTEVFRFGRRSWEWLQTTGDDGAGTTALETEGT